MEDLYETFVFVFVFVFVLIYMLLQKRKFFLFYFHVQFVYLFSKNVTSFNHIENQTQQGGEETMLSADEIRQFFEDYHKRKQQSMGYLDGDNDESLTTEPERGGVEEDSFAPDKKPEIPTHVKYVTQVCMANTLISKNIIQSFTVFFFLYLNLSVQL